MSEWDRHDVVADEVGANGELLFGGVGLLGLEAGEDGQRRKASVGGELEGFEGDGTLPLLTADPEHVFG